MRDQNRESRAARALEFERASLMKPLANYIYDTSVERHCALNEVDCGESPSEVGYVAAWACILALAAMQVTYLLQVATEMGFSKTRIWMMQMALAAAFFYLFVLPLEILFFYARVCAGSSIRGYR